MVFRSEPCKIFNKKIIEEKRKNWTIFIKNRKKNYSVIFSPTIFRGTVFWGKIETLSLSPVLVLVQSLLCIVGTPFHFNSLNTVVTL